MQGVSSDQADRDAFQRKFLIGFNDDGLEVRVFGQQLDMAVCALQAFDCDVITQTSYDDLAIAGF